MLIVRTVERWLRPILLLVSVYLLSGGHQSPGGGFVGGLVAAVPFALHALVYNAPSARRLLRTDPHFLMALGLFCAMWSGFTGVFLGAPYLTGKWVEWELPLLGHVDMGTPVIFDIGVYFAVMGVTLMIILSLAEEE
ncbi:MAG: Na+/H+ antiporter subunit B [Candidatus Omnitrophica bacterium]|nr:Na+/H+ antiporter subunit B [Candidatus Omnitrophota bacterium]